MSPVPRIRETTVMVPLILAAIFGALFFYATIAPRPSQVPGPFDRVRFMAAHESALRELLPDPESARFRKSTVAADDSVVCGQINVRNGTNAYTGFKRFISGPDIRKIEDPDMSGNRRPEYSSGPDEMERLWSSHCVGAK